jgi:hypothetical protein
MSVVGAGERTFFEGDGVLEDPASAILASSCVVSSSTYALLPTACGIFFILFSTLRMAFIASSAIFAALLSVLQYDVSYIRLTRQNREPDAPKTFFFLPSASIFHPIFTEYSSLGVCVVPNVKFDMRANPLLPY